MAIRHVGRQKVDIGRFLLVDDLLVYRLFIYRTVGYKEQRDKSVSYLILILSLP